MKKLILMVAIMILAAGGVSAGTINVDVNDPACVSGTQPDPYAVVYCNIQDAIDDATAGDVINVADGTYAITSAIDVNKGVTITGDVGTPANVLVTYSAPSQTLDCFDMQANDITVQGVKVVNGRYGFNFAASDPTGCTISNCVIDHAYEGAINIDGGSGHTISNNTITNCLTSGTKRGAIHIYGCPNTTIDGNILTDNGLTGYHATMGIYVKFTYPSSSNERVEVINNNISGMLGINADIQIYDAPYTYIYNNTISNSEDKGIAIFGIAGNPAYTGTDNRVQVIGNTISSTYYPGIQAANSPYTYFYDNTLTECNYYGADNTGDWDYSSIHIDIGSANCLIDGNTVSDGINGIQTWSNDVTITNNEVYDMGVTYSDEKVVGDRTYKNSGILVGSNWGSGDIDPTGVMIQDNSIHDNYWGLFYSSDLSNGVNAEQNWWGDVSGPYNATTNPSATGDAVSDDVDYSPWWGADYVDDPHTSPWIWYVNTSNNSTIQEGIDAASASDIVNVTAGTYTITSAIDVNKGVTMTGDVGTPANVVVQYNPASTSLNGFEIGAANITIQGFTISDCFRGVHFDRTDITSTGCTITNCVFDNNSENAIGEVAAENTTISNNTVSNCTQQGIEIRANEATSLANRTEVTGNTISSCGGSCIQTYLGKYVYIYNNTISSTNDKGINIIRPNATGTADRIQVIGNTISLCKYPGIQVIGAPYTYVYNNTLTQCNYYGADGTGDWDYASIHIEDDGAVSGANVIISGNTISDGVNGIQTWANDVTITANEIYDMGVTYGDEKVVGDRTYKNSGILVGSNWGSGDIDPTGVMIQDNSIHDNYWGLFYSSDLSNGVEASGNNWGASDGPEDTDGTDEAYIGQCFSVESMLNIVAEFFPTEGLGNAVSGNVNYCPWIPWSCCVVRGDIDHSGGAEPINIADLVYLVDYMFNEGPQPICLEEADMDATGEINIADLVYLVDYMFNQGPEPVPCP